MGRRGKIGRPIRRRLAAAAGLLALALGIFGWWWAGEWRPSRARFPVQGALLDAGDDAVNFSALQRGGADFAYLRATIGADARDPAFASNLEAARKARLQVGALHRFDPCQGAEPQAGNFVTTVPRDAALLPPAVELELDDAACAAPPAEAALHSELTTFLNQIEGHAGKPAVLKLSRGFEARYRLAGMFERTIWVSGGWLGLDGYLAPGYAGRPWVLWTANPRLRSPALDGRLRWVVARP